MGMMFQFSVSSNGFPLPCDRNGCTMPIIAAAFEKILEVFLGGQFDAE
jgi:hypothetical protein